MARIFHAYIDEAGDEGFGKLRQPDRGGQSTWLMLGAIITSGDHERDLPGWRDEIADGFVHKRRRDLHFQRLNHDQRVFACRLLARRPLGICVVASDKRTRFLHWRIRRWRPSSGKGISIIILSAFFWSGSATPAPARPEVRPRGCR